MKYTYQYLEDSWNDGYWNFIQSNLDKDLDWVALSSNPNITPDIIKNNPDKPWNQYHISLNPNTTNKPIQEYSTVPLHRLQRIAYRPGEQNIGQSLIWFSWCTNLTWEIIQNNPSSHKFLHWGYVSRNTMKRGKQTWINNKRLKIIKAFQIQRHWRNCSNNPEYKLTQKLINNRLT